MLADGIGELERSPLFWAVGLAVTALTAAYVWALRDPMLVYLLLVTGVMAAFPAYQPIVAFVSLLGVYRIALRHDVISGDLSSFVMSTGEGVDITVGGSAVVVTLMSLAPAAKALFSFDLGSIVGALAPAAPFLTLVFTRFFIENASDADVAQLTGAALQHAKEMMKNIRALVAGLGA